MDKLSQGDYTLFRTMFDGIDFDLLITDLDEVIVKESKDIYRPQVNNFYILDYCFVGQSLLILTKKKTSNVAVLKSVSLFMV